MYLKTNIQLRNSLCWKHDKAYAQIVNTGYLWGLGVDRLNKTIKKVNLLRKFTMKVSKILHEISSFYFYTSLGQPMKS